MTTLDQDITEPVTLIKADIEGFEQKALEGAKHHILNDHPKLLFSVYHNNEDLWKIPQRIHQISPEYRFYLRFKVLLSIPRRSRCSPSDGGGKGPPGLVRLGAPFLTKGNRYLWRNSSRHRPDCRMAWAYSRPTYR